MQIEPLRKDIYNKAKNLKIEKIILRFSGGNDEGHLDIDLDCSDWHEDFADMVRDWAWDVYEFSGAGDGSDYGDTIIYDLVNNKASHQEWSMVRQDGEINESKLSLND